MGSLGTKILIATSIFIILIFTGDSLNANCNSVLDKNKVSIKGRIIIRQGNNFPKIISNSSQNFIEKRGRISDNIIAAKGKVPRINGNSYIPISSLESEYSIIKSNKSGDFKTCLPKGTYTFFIVEKDNAYLNSFDGFGFFESFNLNSSDKTITLIKSINATF